MSTSLLALVCPHCGYGLPLHADERILVCPACARSWTSALGDTEPHLVAQARELVAPRQEMPAVGSIVLLPMWLLRVHTHAMGPAGARMAEEIRVPAVGLARMPLLLQFARNLTRSPAVATRWTGARAAPEPAELTAEDAFAVAELVALRHVEGWPPEGQEDVEIALGGARLVDWPCVLRGNELIELVGGLTVHRGIFGERVPADLRQELSPWLSELPAPPTRS
jgi:hypothetical protein